MKNRYTLFVIMVSISVAVLIHFPELVSLLDILEGATLFPEMEPIDVASEVLFTFISLIILFDVNILLFHFNQSGSCYIAYLIRRQQEVVVENQQLQAENILNQYEVLKNQLNPHMLFNSLNTLRSLVREDQDKAQE